MKKRNWFIEQHVGLAIKNHAQNERTYEGVRGLYEVADLFLDKSRNKQVSSIRIKARLSCVDKLSTKYYVISLYQNERDEHGNLICLRQATCIFKKREKLHTVVAKIKTAFSKHKQVSQKYGNKDIELVGDIHLYS